jgi:hypothetical protein
MGKRARNQHRHRAGHRRPAAPAGSQRSRRRERQRERRDGPGGQAAVAAAIEAAVASCAPGVGAAEPRLVEALARMAADHEDGDHDHGDRGDPVGSPDDDPVDRGIAQALADAVAAAWQMGWQPADLHRAAERVRGSAHARLAARAIGHEAQRHASTTIPPHWRMQLDAIGAASGASGVSERWAVPWPAQSATSADRAAPSVARVQAVAVAVEALALVRSLPRLPKLGPLPGEAASPAGGRSRGTRRPVGADPRVLHKVTALLAKAESTNFPDEAEALTGKAQELMTRHAIDQAHLDAQRGDRPRVGGRRVGIDDPYAGARYLLLAAVADANRCRAVWTKYWGFATVFGDESDLDAVELLYTSLLVQATRAMVARPRPRGSGSTRSFRQSFLVAFARRIGVRLHEAAEAVTAEAAQHSTALVPVFAARREAADAALEEAFPNTRSTRMSANDAEGWHAGTQAADRAQLDLHDALRGRSRAS